MAEDKYSSVRLRQSTIQRLVEIGRKGESYDTVVTWLLDHSKKRKSGYSLKLKEKQKKE